MKINWNYIKLLGGVFLIIVLFSFSNERNSKRKLSKMNVEFLDGENHFITYPMVNKLLIQNNDTITSIAKEHLVLNKLEGVLNTNQMIQDAEVYYTVNGQLGAKIRQRKPIARVTGENPFYIDSEGKAMPLSPVFSARVPLISGTVNKEELADVFTLSKYVYEDDFLSMNIIGIHKRGNDFQLKLRMNDFEVLLGSIENMETKFRNFKAFYKKAQKDNTLNKYNTVNLRYNNQVVCAKK